MPIHNADITACFTEIAELLQIQGGNPFRTFPTSHRGQGPGRRAPRPANDRLNAVLHGITLLKGIEVDILEDEHLDLPTSVLSRLDLVHSNFDLSRGKQTARILRAMDAPHFTQRPPDRRTGGL